MWKSCRIGNWTIEVKVYGRAHVAKMDLIHRGRVLVSYDRGDWSIW